MSWQEYVALGYLISMGIVLMLLTMRSIISKVRDCGRNPISEYKANETKNDKRYDKPKPDGVSMGEIGKLHYCPNKKSSTYHNDEENMFRFHIKRIISKAKMMLQPNANNTYLIMYNLNNQ